MEVIFNIGDDVLIGKYKNKKGKVVAFGEDEKGNPTIEIEPTPKGRKKNVTMGLYKVWKPKQPKDDDDDDANESVSMTVGQLRKIIREVFVND